MKVIEQSLQEIFQQRDRPENEVLNYHLLESILRRVAYCAYTEDLVLRGGMLTRLWVSSGHRIAFDVDFLGLYPFSIESTKERFRELLKGDNFSDEVVFDLESLESYGIWLDDPFPGVRVCVDASVLDYRQRLQIDVGFGDPLVPPAQWIEYPTLVAAEPVKLLAARPELMAGWKVHGLIEQGAKRWRPKDLYDLMLLATIVPLDKALLKEAIAVAFSSRNASVEEVRMILTNSQWWNTGKNHRKWRWYCRKVPTQIMPEDFLGVVTTVIDYWGVIIDEI